MSTIITVPGIARTSAWFRWRLLELGKELRIDPDYLATVMSRESGFNPAATNPHTSATGLIQFMPRTAERLGTSVGALRAMTAEQQLPFVQKYYAPFAGRVHNVGDAYMATFMPKYVGQPSETVLFSEGSTGYQQNAGLDLDKDGAIRIGDVTRAAEQTYAAGMNRTRTDVPDEEPARPKVEADRGC